MKCEHRDGWVVKEEGSESINDGSSAWLEIECNIIGCNTKELVLVSTIFEKEEAIGNEM